MNIEMHRGDIKPAITTSIEVYALVFLTTQVLLKKVNMISFYVKFSPVVLLALPA